MCEKTIWETTDVDGGCMVLKDQSGILKIFFPAFDIDKVNICSVSEKAEIKLLGALLDRHKKRLQEQIADVEDIKKGKKDEG